MNPLTPLKFSWTDHTDISRPKNGASQNIDSVKCHLIHWDDTGYLLKSTSRTNEWMEKSKTKIRRVLMILWVNVHHKCQKLENVFMEYASLHILIKYNLKRPLWIPVFRESLILDILCVCVFVCVGGGGSGVGKGEGSIFILQIKKSNLLCHLSFSYSYLLVVEFKP